MAVHLTTHSRRLAEFVRLERYAFAAKIRVARAVLGWSQTELGLRVGLTQRAIHKLEQGETEPRRTTVWALEEVWGGQNVKFEDLADGGFRATIRASVVSGRTTTRRPTSGTAAPMRKRNDRS
jgi:transcriptional regulator with XRE-family HTH domain